MSLRDRLVKASTSKHVAILSESEFFAPEDVVPTIVPMVNVALSGKIDGGLIPGLTMLAGPSKHFKTAFALLLASAYLKKYADAMLLFYDSEFGTPIKYFEAFNIDPARVVHTPMTNVEELKHDIMTQLDGIARGDKVIIVVDSIGNLASKKEVEDALEGKTVADMTRAKAIKSLFRMITPHLRLKSLPMVVVNHTYKTLELYSKDVVGGGTGSYYSAENIWIIGRQQEKEDKEVVGYNFIINVEKSRYVKEKSKIPIAVSFEKGIHQWSGLSELALEGGYIVKVGRSYTLAKNGVAIDEKDKFPAVALEMGGFWKKLFEDTDFADWIKNKYTLVSDSILQETEDDGEI